MNARKQVSSRDNPFYKSLLKLAGSSRERRDLKQTLLDGPHLLRALLDAGLTARHLILTEQATQNEEIMQLLERCVDIPQTQLDSALFAQLSELKTPNGLLALFDIPQPDPSVETGSFVLLLEDIQDPGNLGSIVRSAAAAGCDAVYLSQACADVWSPKVLRAGMGGHFVLDIHDACDLQVISRDFSGQLLAASLQAQASLYECRLTGKTGFIIGNEGAGISAELLAAASTHFVIPMPGRVESLNAAAAAAVCLFEAARQRLVQQG